MIGHLFSVILICAVVSGLSPSYAQEGKKLALLIGNLSYKSEVGSLRNPSKDINLVRSALEASGFRVKTVVDAGRAVMKQEILDFSYSLGSLGPGAIGFFYYSGHGVSRPIHNTNHLIPVDVASMMDRYIWHNLVPVEDIVLDLKANAPLASSFVVVDACRNQLRVPMKGVPKGFSAITEENGIYIALSTGPNQTASDEGEDGGPYARALALEIMQPGQKHYELFANVKRRVFNYTSGIQRTWEINGLIEPVYVNQPYSVVTTQSMPARESLAVNQAGINNGYGNRGVADKLLSVIGIPQEACGKGEYMSYAAGRPSGCRSIAEPSTFEVAKVTTQVPDSASEIELKPYIEPSYEEPLQRCKSTEYASYSNGRFVRCEPRSIAVKGEAPRCKQNERAIYDERKIIVGCTSKAAKRKNASK